MKSRKADEGKGGLCKIYLFIHNLTLVPSQPVNTAFEAFQNYFFKSLYTITEAYRFLIKVHFLHKQIYYLHKKYITYISGMSNRFLITIGDITYDSCMGYVYMSNDD